MKQHEGQQAQGLRLREEVHKQAAQVKGLLRQVRSDEVLSLGGGKAFVIHQVHHLKDGTKTVRQLGPRGNLIGDPLLGSGDPLGHGGRGKEKGPRNFFGRKAADFPERQGNPAILGQVKMATGEDEAELVVLDGIGIQYIRIRVELPGFPGNFRQRGVVTTAPANDIYPLEPARRNKPRPRIPGQARTGPLFQGRPEGLLEGLFRQVEVTEQTDQGGQHLP